MEKIKIAEKLYAAYKQEAEMFITVMLANPAMEKQLAHLVNHFFRLRTDTVMPFGKGVLLHGSVGQGKTFSFEVVKSMLFRKQLSSFVMGDTKTMCSEFSNPLPGKGGRNALLKYINAPRLLIDELGGEFDLEERNKTTPHYGDRLFVVQYVLIERYEKWRSNGFITYGTSNLPFNQLEEFYGIRAADRIMEMCSILKHEFSEKSFRMTTDSRQLTLEEKRQREQARFKTKEKAIPTQTELDTETAECMNYEAEMYRKTPESFKLNSYSTGHSWYHFFERNKCTWLNKKAFESKKAEAKELFLKEKDDKKLANPFQRATEPENHKIETRAYSLIAVDCFKKHAKKGQDFVKLIQ